MQSLESILVIFKCQYFLTDISQTLLSIQIHTILNPIILWIVSMATIQVKVKITVINKFSFWNPIVVTNIGKVQVFWEDHKNLTTSFSRFWRYLVIDKALRMIGPNFCSLLRISELYMVPFRNVREKTFKYTVTPCRLSWAGSLTSAVHRSFIPASHDTH